MKHGGCAPVGSEAQLAQQVKSLGGRWNQQKRAWKVAIKYVKILGIAADTFPTQHPMARITKSLFQATHCEVKGKEYNWEDNHSLQRTEKAPPLNFALCSTPGE